MTEKLPWVLGGKNIDEDPLFSEYYLLDSAKTYGAVRAFYNGFTEAYYIPAEAADQLAKRYVEKLIKNPVWMQKTLSDTAVALEEIEQFSNKHSVATVATMDLATLRRLYNKQRQLTQKLYKLSRVPQALDRGSDLFTLYIMDQLRALAGDEEAVALFVKLTTPLEVSRFELAELCENEIVNEFLALPTTVAPPIWMMATPAQIGSVKAMAKMYSHIAYHGYGKRVVLGANDFWNRIQQKVVAGKMLPTVTSSQAKYAQLQAEQRELAQRYQLDKKFQDLLSLYGTISLAKINRRFIQIKNFVVLDAIITRLSELQSIPEAILRFMTQEEFYAVFDGEKLATETIRKRRDASVWTYDGDSITIVTSPAACRRLAEDTIPVERPQTNLTGTVVAVPNRSIQARARLVFRAEDAFSPGDILVSEATDPDLVKHIGIASAVLTEQGGVTSHASILTRELGIPCIVGIAGLLCSVQNNDLLEIDTKTGVIVNLGQQHTNVVDLAHLPAASTEEFGGKGYGLWKLHSIGLGSYLPQTYLVRPTFSEKNKEDLKAISLVSTALQSSKVAIRSSSILEDSNSMSWAGQFPTFLDVIADAVQIRKKLLELLEWEGTRDYTNGEKVSNVPMSAVIQEQVDSLYSGVCFTKCPVQNDRSKIIIELSEGMGDALVSGKNVPDRITYSKDKAEFTEYLPQRYASAINQALFELVSSALKADSHWGRPVDIEFAIDQQYNLRLLQCRPITS